MIMDRVFQDPRPMEEQYKELLTNLSGIFSAKIALDGEGNIREIHILASANRNVKQVVRDVRSALNSYFNLDVDHRLISVAQMKEDPTETSEDPDEPQSVEYLPYRLRCGRISQSIEDDNYSVTVTLKYHDQVFDGSASSKSSEQQRQYCIASAVLNAIHNFLGQDNLFSLMTVKRITNTPVPICMVLMEFMSDLHNHSVLVGAAEIGPDEAVSIERATLDAINRKMSMFAANLTL